MEPEHFLQKTDLILYKKILNMIVKDWDGMETDRLSELLSQLRVLHDNLDKVIIQKKQQSLFDKNYYKSNFDRGSVKENVDLKSISLSKMIPHSQRFRRQKVK
jgi:ubiquinone biosynthesis protein Coq4